VKSWPRCDGTLDERTLVVFRSDNGPFLSYGEHAGSAGPLREGKLTTFGGGVDVPCVMRWPGRVPVVASAMNSSPPWICSRRSRASPGPRCPREN
jgi:hypothetical protein